MGNQVLLCYGERLFNLQCLSILAKKKKSNLEPQYNALHSNKFGADFPPKSGICELQLKGLKSTLAAQQQLMAKPSHLLTMQPYHPSRSVI
jgi:hypothetical protein